MDAMDVSVPMRKADVHGGPAQQGFQVRGALCFAA